MASRIFLYLSLMAISACSAVNNLESLAQEGKWFEIGKYDGDKGLAARNLDELKRLANGNAIDFLRYDSGYQQGIEAFCDPSHAYTMGLAGIQYQGTCGHFPHGLRFSMEWQRGYQEYQYQR